MVLRIECVWGSRAGGLGMDPVRSAAGIHAELVGLDIPAADRPGDRSAGISHHPGIHAAAEQLVVVRRILRMAAGPDHRDGRPAGLAFFRVALGAPEILLDSIE